MSTKRKPTEIDMILATESVDIHQERLKIDGCDISDLEMGRGKINDNHSKGFLNTIGRITQAKKIFKKEDCENERQKYYWNKVKSPYIYAKGVLFDDEEQHENAKAAAAVLKSISKAGFPLAIKASVEGGTIARGGVDNRDLVKTKVHSAALTFSPANAQTWVEPLSLEKSSPTSEDEALIKNAMALAIDDVPTFIDIDKKMQLLKIEQHIDKIKDLKKSMLAGFGGAGAPTDLTYGGVVQSESVEDGLKYITCPNCGKEQVHQKNQVKCRNCNKGFRLKHLVKFTF